MTHSPASPYRARVVRKAYFSAAYEDSKGRMSGHNYVLEASVEGEISPDSGMVIGIAELKELMSGTARQLDHKFLNRDVPAFRAQAPSVENLAIFCFEDLKTRLQPLTAAKLVHVRVYENEDLWADYGVLEAFL